MRRLGGIWIFGILALALACGDEVDIYNPLTPGQTDFTNTEPGTSNDHYGLDQDSANKGGATGASPSTPAPGAPPQGRTGEVEEADIYKVDQDRLFYLNTYRGFMIYDMKDPKSPSLISRLPVYGYPIEMFIKGNTVYALIRDALYLTQESGQLKFKRHNVSQLVAIDITDLKNPQVLQTVDITGQLREGVSRKIDDTIYVVSYISRYYYPSWSYYGGNSQQQKEQAWVYSFNVKDPKKLQVIQKMKVFEGGGYSNSTSGASESRYFSSVTISATSNMLMVVENWRRYGYSSGSKYNCSSYQSLQEAVVTLVDISDPKGYINTWSRFTTYGELGDQFKQTYIYDKQTNKATYLGIFARREWMSANCSGTTFIENTLESWDITDGSKPVRQDSLSFGKKNETVRGSVFDPDRRTAFAITARQVDPLYALSFADPKDLKITSEVDNLSGDMNVFKFVENRKFLVAIGRDNTKACDGFANNNSGWSTGVAVSLIDVQDLTNIRLVQRQCVAVKDASWVSSGLNWDRDQAHKMIGMHTSGKINVITVPVYYYTKHKDDRWHYYRYQTAVGVMGWDLTKYDVTKAVPQSNVLGNFGTIIHPKGQVKRSVLFTHKAKNKRMVVNLSDTHVSLSDLSNLAKPELQSVIEVAPYYRQVFRFGDYMVEQVEQGGSGSYYYGSSYGGATEFRVKKTKSAKSLEQAPEVASFSAGQVERVVKVKDKLVLFRRLFNEATKTGYPYGTYSVQVLVYDMSNPTKPVKRGAVELPMSYMPYYYYWCGDWGYWGGYWFDSYWNYYGYNSSWTVTDDGIAFLSQQYDYQIKGYSRRMLFVDLSNASKPSYKELKLTSDKDWNFFSVVSQSPDPKKPTLPTSLYLTYRIKVGQVKVDNHTLNMYKYYAQRWDKKGSAWGKGPAFNLPGRLIKVWKKGTETRFLTFDYTYAKKYNNNGNGYYYWQPSYRLNLLRQSNIWGQPMAELLDYNNFKSLYLNDLVMDGQMLYINAGAGYGYSATGDWTKDSDRLMIYDLSGYTMDQKYAQPTGTYNARLMGTHNGKLFVNLPGDGVLVVDTSNPAKPDGKQFMRTLGYATHIEFDQDTAYVAAGNFGIYEMNLNSGKAITATK